jgi:hypothetical protein
VSARIFAEAVVRNLCAEDARASFLEVRARGKTAVIGYESVGEWIPLLRIAGGSGAYNVADLQVRHRSSWQPTLIRGVPAKLAQELAGPIAFVWQLHVDPT